MGFGDKLKGIRDQAQAAVAENKDKIQGAVQSAGEVANTKTHGKYTDKIVKVGDKMNASVEKLSGSPEEAGAPIQPPGADAEATAAEPASNPAPAAGGAAPDFDE
jgi:MT0933-like antitoxin protein